MWMMVLFGALCVVKDLYEQSDMSYVGKYLEPQGWKWSPDPSFDLHDIEEKYMWERIESILELNRQQKFIWYAAKLKKLSICRDTTFS